MALSDIQNKINRIETEIAQRTQDIWVSSVQPRFDGYISTYGPIQIVCNPTEKYILGILEDGTKNYSTEVVGVIQELQTDLSIANNIFEPNTNYDPDDNKDGNHDNDDIYDTMSITELKQNKITVYNELAMQQDQDWVITFTQPICNGFINDYQPIIFKTVDGIEYIIDETADFSQASTIVLTYTQPEPEVGDDTVSEDETDEDLLPSNSDI